MNGVLLTALLVSSSTTWQIRGAIGGQLDADPHGVFDLGVRKGDASMELFTDTLDLRYAPDIDGGRAYFALRGEARFAGLFISPWTDGAPDDGRAFKASYGGADAGLIRYLPFGLYAGVHGTARYYVFSETDQTTTPIPKNTHLIRPEVSLGWWHPAASAEIRGGAAIQRNGVSGRGAFVGRFVPDLIVGPRVELYAGLGHQQNDLVKTRVGGLNPYVVPLAGAAWAEIWSRRYVVVRAGPKLSLDFLDISAVTDVAYLDGRTSVGTGLLTKIRLGTLFIEASGGYAPVLIRALGVSRFSLWVRVGTEWRQL